MYFLPDLKTNSLQESQMNLLDAIKGITSKKRCKYFFRIELKSTLKHIGEIGYTVVDFTPIGKIVHLGYFTHSEYWNNGYTTEAVQEVARFAFEDDNVFRISTGYIKDNIGSERIMQKCGMIKEADSKLIEWHNGKMKDRVSYRLLKSEWIEYTK